MVGSSYIHESTDIYSSFYYNWPKKTGHFKKSLGTNFWMFANDFIADNDANCAFHYVFNDIFWYHLPQMIPTDAHSRRRQNERNRNFNKCAKKVNILSWHGKYLFVTIQYQTMIPS